MNLLCASFVKSLSLYHFFSECCNWVIFVIKSSTLNHCGERSASPFKLPLSKDRERFMSGLECILNHRCYNTPRPWVKLLFLGLQVLFDKSRALAKLHFLIFILDRRAAQWKESWFADDNVQSNLASSFNVVWTGVERTARLPEPHRCTFHQVSFQMWAKLFFVHIIYYSLPTPVQG